MLMFSFLFVTSHVHADIGNLAKGAIIIGTGITSSIIGYLAGKSEKNDAKKVKCEKYKEHEESREETAKDILEIYRIVAQTTEFEPLTNALDKIESKDIQRILSRFKIQKFNILTKEAISAHKAINTELCAYSQKTASLLKNLYDLVEKKKQSASSKEIYDLIPDTFPDLSNNTPIYDEKSNSPEDKTTGNC